MGDRGCHPDDAQITFGLFQLYCDLVAEVVEDMRLADIWSELPLLTISGQIIADQVADIHLDVV